MRPFAAGPLGWRCHSSTVHLLSLWFEAMWRTMSFTIILNFWLDMSGVPPLPFCVSKCVNFQASREHPTTQCQLKFSLWIVGAPIVAEKVDSSKLKTYDGRWWRWLRNGGVLLGQSLKVVLLSIATDGAGWWSESFIWPNTHQWMERNMYIIKGKLLQHFFTWSLKQDCLHEGLCTWQNTEGYLLSLNGCQRTHMFVTTAATSFPVGMFRRNEQMSDATNY